MKKVIILVLFIFLMSSLMFATPTITPTVTETITETITLTSTVTITETFTPTPSMTSTETATNINTSTITQTSTITPTFTATPTPQKNAYAYPNPAKNTNTIGFAYPIQAVKTPISASIIIKAIDGEEAGRSVDQTPNGYTLVDISRYARGIYIYQTTVRYSDGTSEKMPAKKFAVIK